MVMTFSGLDGWLVATVIPSTQQLPDNRITSRSYNHLCVTFVLRAATSQPRRQHWWCWHNHTLAKLRLTYILLELLTASYNNQLEGLPNRVDDKYCDFEALSQDRNLAVMKWADNKDVTCYNNDNHDHKIIIEQSMLLMIAASEPDKSYPNSKFYWRYQSIFELIIIIMPSPCPAAQIFHLSSAHMRSTDFKQNNANGNCWWDWTWFGWRNSALAHSVLQ